MATYDEIVAMAIEQSKATGDEWTALLNKMIEQTQTTLRQLKLKDVEQFIEACEVLVNGNLQMQSGLLDLILSRRTMGENLYWLLEMTVDTSDKESIDNQKMLNKLSRYSLEMAVRYVIEAAKNFKKQKQTIESLSLALNACKGGSDEA